MPDHACVTKRTADRSFDEESFRQDAIVMLLWLLINLFLHVTPMEIVQTPQKRRLCGYMGISLDGFVAKSDGSLDWLTKYESVKELGPLYDDFLKPISCVITGRKTLDFVVDAVSSTDEIYPNKKVYVLTHRDLPMKDERFEAVHGNLVQALEKIEGDVYVDSPSAINELWDHMDSLMLTICPVALGEGIPLFHGERTNLEIVRVLPLPGSLVQIEYKVCRK